MSVHGGFWHDFCFFLRAGALWFLRSVLVSVLTEAVGAHPGVSSPGEDFLVGHGPDSDASRGMPQPVSEPPPPQQQQTTTDHHYHHTTATTTTDHHHHHYHHTPEPFWLKATTDRNTRCLLHVVKGAVLASPTMTVVLVPLWLLWTFFGEGGGGLDVSGWHKSFSVVVCAVVDTAQIRFCPRHSFRHPFRKVHEFKGLPQFGRDFASFFVGLVAAIVVAPLRSACRDASPFCCHHVRPCPSRARPRAGERQSSVTLGRDASQDAGCFCSSWMPCRTTRASSGILESSWVARPVCFAAANVVSSAQFMTHSLLCGARVQLT